MKQIKIYSCFTLLITYIFFSLSVTNVVSGEDNNITTPPKPASTETGKELVGTVVELSQQFSEENFAILATSKSAHEFMRTLAGMLLREPAVNITVTAKSRSITRATKTDNEGKFKFIGLPSSQHYEISAEKPSRFYGTGESRMAKAKIPFEFQGRNWVRLELRTDLVTLKGRVLDAQGQPIASAKLRGVPCADLTSERDMFFPTRHAVSGKDGSYVLIDIVPPDISDIAAYLKGRDPIGFSEDPFYLAIYVTADGYVQDKVDAPRVPLITEELLVPARRFETIMTAMETLSGRNKIERKPLPLPASQSNTITGIDIVLKKAGDAENQDGK